MKTDIDATRQAFLLALGKQQAGKPKEAEGLYLSYLDRDPESAEANHNLGLIVMDRGQFGAAIAYFARAARLQPELMEAHLNLGEALAKAGRHAEAEASFRRAISLGGDKPRPYVALANLLASRGRLEEAESSYREAIRIDPRFCDAYNNLSNVLRQQDRRDEALALLGQALAIDPTYVRAHNNAGNILRDLDRLEESEASYREAVRLAPDFALAHFNLGNALRDLGRMPEAEASFRKAIELKPTYADAYRHLAQVADLAPNDLLVGVMEDKLSKPRLRDDDRMHYAFALGLIYDKHGDYDRAFSHFQTANSLKRKTFAYDPKSNDLLFSRIRKRFGTQSMAGARPCGHPDETPIFIVGMMRSGTTLMEQVLASHPDVAGGGELTFLQALVDGRAATAKAPYPEFLDSMQDADFLEMGRQYVAMARDKFGPERRFITDKMPQNFLYLGLIQRILPKARIIYMDRDPLDTCLSIYSILFSQHHPYAYDLREAGLYAKFSRELMAFWKGLLGDRLYWQRYEALVDDPEPAVRNLLAFCDLAFHADCLNFHQTERMVRTASASQVRERLHSRSVARWKNYARQLGPLRAVFEGRSA